MVYVILASKSSTLYREVHCSFSSLNMLEAEISGGRHF